MAVRQARQKIYLSAGQISQYRCLARDRGRNLPAGRQVFEEVVKASVEITTEDEMSEEVVEHQRNHPPNNNLRMFHFTKQERAVLLSLAAVVSIGSALHVTFLKYPELKDIVNFADSPRAYPKVNVNTASAEELVALPYIGEKTAKNIITFRSEHGRFLNLEDIKKVKGIREKNYQIFSKYLEAR
ncbi:MAG: helix-hairpin-helix domain-containing protein [Candidatus Omnitrophica bacterium]|nr:helix-hairpin-helix domain-containing protein [Candidatus Omnitrophota bacterium]